MAGRLRRVALPWLALALAFLHLGYWSAIPGAMDPDAYWVAAAGRWMFAHHAVPRLNLFSFTDPGRPWTMHEWLFGPLYATGLSRLGPRFFSYFVLLTAAATAVVLIATCASRARDWRVGALLAALALVAFGPRLASPRPPGVALFFPVAMAALAFGARFGWLEALAVIGLELVWTNAHGSFPLGPLLLLAGALARREGRRARLLASFAAALATLVNPYGLRLHALVLGYALGSDPTLAAIRAHVLEFGPIWRAWNRVGALAWVGALVLIAIAVRALWPRRAIRTSGQRSEEPDASASSFGHRQGAAESGARTEEVGASASPPGSRLAAMASGRRPDDVNAAFTPRHRVEAVLALLLFAYAALGVRHVELAGLVSAVLLAPALDEVIPRVELPLAPMRLALIAVLPALVIYLPWVATGHAKDADRLSPTLGGDALVSLAAKLPKDAQVFTTFRAAGPLLWFRGDPSVRVFYDSRNDCYSPGTIQTFLDLDTGGLPLGRVAPSLAHYGTTAALVPVGHGVAQALGADRSWRLSRRAGTWLLFEKSPVDAPRRGPPGR